MKISKNPFVDLYVTEHVSAEKFVRIFSPILVEDSQTHMLFQPGNVILTGLQGSGKTALLNLLKPEVFVAYFKSDVEWPLPSHCAKFISAGINLARSSAIDFGQRQVKQGDYDQEKIIALYFADFINYWIVDDLLNTIDIFRTEDEASAYLGLRIESDLLDMFAAELSKNKCWLGGLESVNSYSALKEKIAARIASYRDFLNFNSELPTDIQVSKTSPGEPISIVAELLRNHHIIPEELPIFIKIDQFENLMGLEKEEDGSFSGLFRSTIMKFIGTRDERVSYRIGARPYSYYPDFSMYGTDTSVEEKRDFQRLDIGNLLSRKEARLSLFPKFCNDIFARRLNEAGIKLNTEKRSATSQVFGKRASPSDKAKDYVKNNFQAIFKLPTDWPNESKIFLIDLAERDPLSAKLGEAWIMQRIAKKQPRFSFAEIAERPWDQANRTWWKKERIQQALLQISARRQQRMKWYGADDVIALSGRNVLVFLTINQFIWSEYLRTGKTLDQIGTESMPNSIQDMGIQEASAFWFRKIKADPNGGDDRHRFINVLGSFLRTKLREDSRMSYPGANGFSLSEKDLGENLFVTGFLDRCEAYGVLETVKHTPKSKSRGQSRKWYLFSILSPYFQIPNPHTKEPFYANVDDVQHWLAEAKVISTSDNTFPQTKRKRTLKNIDQKDLFDERK